MQINVHLSVVAVRLKSIRAASTAVLFHSAGQHVRHYLINGIVNRALVRGGIAAVKEPNGIVATSSVRPDGTTLIPWSDGKCLSWDATAPDTFAAKNIPATSELAGAAAEQASLLKNQKYNAVSPSHPFVGMVVEPLGILELVRVHLS